VPKKCAINEINDLAVKKVPIRHPI
jgi:hypothetical protein